MASTFHGGVLFVTVIEARGLGNGGGFGGLSGGVPSPYVVLTFQDKEVQTATQKKTSTPSYNADYQFEVTRTSATLVLRMFSDKLGKDALLGEVLIPLSDVIDGQPQQRWFALGPEGRKGVQGEVHLKVHYMAEEVNAEQQSRAGRGRSTVIGHADDTAGLPSRTLTMTDASQKKDPAALLRKVKELQESLLAAKTERERVLALLRSTFAEDYREWCARRARGQLRVSVIEARGLMKADTIGSSDPYAAVSFGGVRKKTEVVKDNLNPSWGEEFHFRVGNEVEGDILIELFDWDRSSEHDFMGQARIALDDLFDEKLHDRWLKLERAGHDLDSARVKGDVHVAVQFVKVVEEVDTASTLEGALDAATVLDELSSVRAALVDIAEQSEGRYDKLQRQRDDLVRKLKRLFDSEFHAYCQAKVVGVLHVEVVAGRDLTQKDTFGKSDPFARIKLDNKEFRSPTRSNTLNPHWDGEARYKFDCLSRADELVITLFDEDDVGKDAFMGLIQVSVATLPAGEDVCKWYDLGIRTPQDRVSGALQLKLRFEAADEDLQEGVNKGVVEEVIEEVEVVKRELKRRYEEEVVLKDQALAQRHDMVEQIRDLFRATFQLYCAPKHKAELHVTLVEARGLPKMDMGFRGKADAYVRATLEDDTFETSVQHKTLNPRWDQTHTFKVHDEQGDLVLRVFDYDNMGSDDGIGEVIVPLRELPAGREVDQWHRLRPYVGGSDKVAGELHICARYTPVAKVDLAGGAGGSALLFGGAQDGFDDLGERRRVILEARAVRDTLMGKVDAYDSFVERIKSLFVDEYYQFCLGEVIGRLKVNVVEARGVAKMDLFGKSDPYCTVEFANKRKKTDVQKKTLDPRFSRGNFRFAVHDSDTSGVLTLRMWDWDMGPGDDDFMGEVQIKVKDIMEASARIREEHGGENAPLDVEFEWVGWWPLRPRSAKDKKVKGEVRLEVEYVSTELEEARKAFALEEKRPDFMLTEEEREAKRAAKEEAKKKRKAANKAKKKKKGKGKGKGKDTAEDAAAEDAAEGEARAVTFDVPPDAPAATAAAVPSASALPQVRIGTSKDVVLVQRKDAMAMANRVKKALTSQIEGAKQLVEQLFDMYMDPFFDFVPPRHFVRVEVCGAAGLRAADMFAGTSDPYALVVFGEHEEKTAIIDKTLDPEWNETFTFEVENVESSELEIAVYDYDRVGGHDFLGQVVVPLTFLEEGVEVEQHYPLQKKKKRHKVKGKLHLKLLYFEETEEMVAAEEARLAAEQAAKQASGAGAEAAEAMLLEDAGVNKGRVYRRVERVTHHLKKRAFALESQMDGAIAVASQALEQAEEDRSRVATLEHDVERLRAKLAKEQSRSEKSLARNRRALDEEVKEALEDFEHRLRRKYWMIPRSSKGRPKPERYVPE